MSLSRTTHITVLGSLLLGVASSAVSIGGVVTGQVVDDKGAPIANAIVIYRSIQKKAITPEGYRTETGPRLASGIRTAGDGSFVVRDLPPATYYLCAYGVKDAHLGSCEWGAGTTRIELASGQTVQLKFQVAEGTLLSFEVQDPRQQIRDTVDLHPAKAAPVGSRGNFTIGVWAGTRYARAKLISNIGAVRRYQLAIPKTASVRLFLDTPLVVQDAAGTTLAVRRQSTTLSAAGKSEVSTSLRIP